VENFIWSVLINFVSLHYNIDAIRQKREFVTWK
jgi:hypothetical protein